jgi:hypothetical protein
VDNYRITVDNHLFLGITSINFQENRGMIQCPKTPFSTTLNLISFFFYPLNSSPIFIPILSPEECGQHPYLLSPSNPSRMGLKDFNPQDVGALQENDFPIDPFSTYPHPLLRILL